ncbi:MAG: zinc ribbon domain-containing protein [Anaerolineae bacterium]|nr:zinc ribbon domain-containing protein [Anaerolineae bacterium]
MPTYVYQCDAPGCGHRFEVRHGVAACDAPGATPPCPACGAATTHRAPQRVAVNWGGLPPSAGRSRRRCVRSWMRTTASVAWRPTPQRRRRVARRDARSWMLEAEAGATRGGPDVRFRHRVS